MYILLHTFQTLYNVSFGSSVSVLVICVQVSGAVCFLLSPAAAYITGCTIPVDGGQGIYRSPWVIQGIYCTPTHTHTHSLSLTHTHTLSLSLPLSLSDHEGFPAQLHSDVELPPKGEVTEPAPSEDLYRALLELYKSKL